MMGNRALRQFRIDVQSLSLSVHTFDFEVNEAFFSSFDHSVVDRGVCKVILNLDKRETLMEANFQIEGYVKLICDRSLREFDHLISAEKKVVFKFGEEWEELDVDIYTVPRNLDQLDVSSYIYEFISLEVPMKRLHPDLMDQETDDGVVYSTELSKEEKEETPDPRWEGLKKLKK